MKTGLVLVVSALFKATKIRSLDFLGMWHKTSQLSLPAVQKVRAFVVIHRILRFHWVASAGKSGRLF